MPPRSSVTVIVPAFNEAGRIEQVIESLQRLDVEIIVVDDASTDGTATVCTGRGISVISHSTNRGYVAAIKTGFRAAKTEVVVTYDADGEFDPQDVESLVEPVVAGRADMVQGRRNRIVRPSESILTWFAGLGGPVGDSGTGMRALRTELAKQLDIKGKCICGVLALEVLERGGRITEVPVQLKVVDKPRGVAWYHFSQFFWVLLALLRRFTRSQRREE